MLQHKTFLTITAVICLALPTQAQQYTRYTTTESEVWQTSEISLKGKSEDTPLITISGNEVGTEFKAWGTTFNELDWDAFNLLTRDEQDEVMRRMFSPDGDLHFTAGRISMNANDYSRAWYSCDDVDGDLGLRYFNIEHDKRNIIPLARAAQKYCPDLKLFMSPWSPPVWMKINHDYPVSPNKTNKMDERQGYLLYWETPQPPKGGDNTAASFSNISPGQKDSPNGAVSPSMGLGSPDPDEMKLTGVRNNVFPRKLASQDFMIQDPRYLQAYADMFCRFIDLYKEQGLPITKVMYQNEAYSYTPYPGCAWTAEGTLRFNNDYLAPTLRAKHPDVELWIGTFNTNRLDYVEKILDDTTLQRNITGIGTQWECRNNLPQMRERYPNARFMVSESECGNGQMDWKAAEHTFLLLSDNLGNGCDEYYNWNFILTDNGISPWGWTQNALIQVDSKTRQIRYTPEFYAYKHFCHFVAPGTHMIAYQGGTNTDFPIVVFLTSDNKHVITAGNSSNEARNLCLLLGNKYLTATIPAHSFNTFVEN